MDDPEIKKAFNCIKLNARKCFPDNILASVEHANSWLRSKRDIPSYPTGRISPSIILESLW